MAHNTWDLQDYHFVTFHLFFTKSNQVNSGDLYRKYNKDQDQGQELLRHYFIA